METSFHLRKATETDAGRIWEIILQAKAQMYREDKKQWHEGYPAPANITNDIHRGHAHVLCDGEEVIAYGAVIFEGEPAYLSIDGKWLNDEPYVVVHRLAVAEERKQRGVATQFMREVEKLSAGKSVFNFRVDTNYDNFYMHRMLERLGFTYCGEIRYDSGIRMAYQKRLSSFCS